MGSGPWWMARRVVCGSLMVTTGLGQSGGPDQVGRLGGGGGALGPDLLQQGADLVGGRLQPLAAQVLADRPFPGPGGAGPDLGDGGEDLLIGRGPDLALVP